MVFMQFYDIFNTNPLRGGSVSGMLLSGSRSSVSVLPVSISVAK